MYPATQDTLRSVLPSKLMNGEVTFMCGYFYSANMLREMKSDYGIIPFPKLDESIENYSALVHDSAQLVSVPVTCDKLDAVCAALEAVAAENYKTVFPAYYEVALKTKYTRDDLSGQIIDLIHDSGTTDLAYIYNVNVGYTGHLYRTLMTAKSSDLASEWAKISAAAEKGLAELIEKYSQN